MKLGIGLVCMLGLAAALPGQTVLVEAEGFTDLGGWSVDQQFMDQMGSPFLLAHGLGTPVPDAHTSVQVPAPGTYRVWVRTRDWVAKWKAAGAPGRFQVTVDGVALGTTFGTEGADWHWQDGGTVKIAGRRITLGLHDLTGFDGRCDAIVLAKDGKWTPLSGDALARFRREQLGFAGPRTVGPFDFVVAGGGMAGLSAALAAARLGVKVALIQDRPVLGGNGSSEVRVNPEGRTMLGQYPALGALEHEFDPGSSPELRAAGSHNAIAADYYADEKKNYLVRSEKNLTLFVNTRVVAVEKSGNRIAAVIARDVRTNEDLRFPAGWFADCTGDANLGFLAGADYHVGRESRADTGESLAPEVADKQVMGTSYMWYAEEMPGASAFPETPWALEFNERTAQRTTKGDWDWESGMLQDQVNDAESIRDHSYRAIYGNWSFLKNHAENRAAYERQRMTWLAYVAGKRESRRLIGDVLLKQQDVTGHVPYPDSSVTTTWNIDLHYPKPENTAAFPGAEFRSIAKFEKQEPYAIPYRCFYSRNVENLFMAGRNISVTHVALGTVRVQRTTAMMGEVVGMAVSLCLKGDTTPRGVYEKHLDALKALMTKGVGKEENIAVAVALPLGFSAAADGGVANWKPSFQGALVARVLFHSKPEASGDSSAAIEILHNGFKAVKPLNAAAAKDEWIDLGLFQFTGSGTDVVRLIRKAGGRAVRAEDVKFEVLRPDHVTLRQTVVLKDAGK